MTIRKPKEPKLRTVWDFSPVTRVKQSKKAYKRQKIDWKKELNEEE